jgi:FkbM family methyltransferase
VKSWLVERLPRRYELPLRYHYRRIRGRLERELPLIREMMQGGKTAVDVGANYGLYTYMLARVCRRVEAFEPIPRCAAVIRAYGAANVGVHEVALSSAAGTRTLHIPLDRGAPNRESATLQEQQVTGGTALQIEALTLDEFGYSGVSFVKIDVEGHELEVLRGGEATIRRERPVLLVEVEQRHLRIPMQRVFEFVTGLGYRGWFMDGGALRPLAEFRYEVHQEPYLANVLSGLYVNNFVFLP